MRGFTSLALLIAAAFGVSAGAAAAQTLPGVPAGLSDAVLTFTPSGLVDIIGAPEPANPSQQDGILNTGITTNAPDGFGVKLTDFGKEGGSPTPIDSDYIYAFAGFIYFDSDSEKFIPTPTHPIDPANLIPLRENGQWQQLDQYWTKAGWTVATPFWVFSDIPEPAAWPLMLVGVSLMGATLRRRRAASLAAA